MSILKKPTARATLRHYGHNMSFRRSFTATTGMLLPVMWDYLNPNETIRINESMFFRTQPLKTAAFARATLHCYYFFVPICQLNPYFEQAFYGISDMVNSNDPNVAPSANNPFPHNEGPAVSQSILLSNLKIALIGTGGGTTTDGFTFSTGDGYNTCTLHTRKSGYHYNGTFGLDEYGVPIVWNVLRLMDLLDYGSDWCSKIGVNTGASHVSQNFSVNVLLLQAYQKIFMDYFRIAEYTPNNVFAFNAGYAMRDKAGAGATPTSGWSYDYQNIHLQSRGGKEYLYNGLFKMRYHPLKKDFFTSIMPTPLFDVNSPSYGYNESVTQGGLNSMVLSAYGVQLQGPGYYLNGLHTNMGVTTTAKTENYFFRTDESVGVNWPAQGGSGTFSSIQQLRLAYAYDRLLSITQRGGKHVDDQTMAHWGVRPNTASTECVFLGAHRTPLRIGEVIATADGSSENNSTSTLGQIAGRGLAAQGNQRTITYKTKQHGVLMAIFSIVPDVDYKGIGLDIRHLRNSIMQWPRPEFDNLGMQPLFQIQSFFSVKNWSEGAPINNDANIKLGWQYRYSEEKLSYDRVNNGLLYSLRDWTPSTVFNQFGRTFADGLYVSPNYFDSIFALSFLPAPSVDNASFTEYILSQDPVGATDWTPREGNALTFPFNMAIGYQRDPFIGYIDFDYKKSSVFSTYSLPNL